MFIMVYSDISMMYGLVFHTQVIHIGKCVFGYICVYEHIFIFTVCMCIYILGCGKEL